MDPAAHSHVAFAPAKVNLTLRVLGRRPDGYHEIESLVVFAAVGDRLTLTPGEALGLDVRGRTAAEAGAIDDNLVFRAARALADRIPKLALGHFALEKVLPVAAGIGGGSSDAAAALRLLARVNHLRLDDPRLLAAAAATGADVPVCLDPRPRVMRGVGDVLAAPLDLPPLPAVLVNPRVAVPTKDVFAELGLEAGDVLAEASPDFDTPVTADFFHAIAAHSNDLESPAIRVQPVISDVLDALEAQEGRLVRMSGSGATCFGLFDSAEAARDAAAALSRAHPGWWVQATTLGSGEG